MARQGENKGEDSKHKSYLKKLQSDNSLLYPSLSTVEESRFEIFTDNIPVKRRHSKSTQPFDFTAHDEVFTQEVPVERRKSDNPKPAKRALSEILKRNYKKETYREDGPLDLNASMTEDNSSPETELEKEFYFRRLAQQQQRELEKSLQETHLADFKRDSFFSSFEPFHSSTPRNLYSNPFSTVHIPPREAEQPPTASTITNDRLQRLARMINALEGTNTVTVVAFIEGHMFSVNTSEVSHEMGNMLRSLAAVF